MSNALNPSENSYAAFVPTGTDNPAPMPLSYFIQHDCPVDTNLSPHSANPDKIALNDHQGLTPSLGELAHIRAALRQLSEVQRQQADDIQALKAENQTLRNDNHASRSRVNELYAREETQDKLLADYRGGLRAIEMALRSLKLDQSAQMNDFEQTYQNDKVQTGRRQQAKDQQMELRLQSLVDLMLDEAVEKAIRLLRLDNRRIPTPAKQSSTPSLNHLYINQVYPPKQTD